LQKGPGQGATADYFERAPLLNLGAEIADFADTMAVVETLDLVITVDTAVAHLAGAMGKPVWILLPYAPDWRWLLERSDSPWYPTARLFRQPSPGDWDSVAHEVAKALSEPEQRQLFLGTANGFCAGARYPSFAEPNIAARV
jgi:hypothetical protein